MLPEYSYPLSTLLGAARDWIFLRRRSFRKDAQACVRRIRPPLRVLGAENIPSEGPCLLTFNHYYRPGFGAWWMALALAASLPLEAHYIMTGELTFPGKWYARAGMAFSRILLARAARMYGFTSMPPMPPRPQDVEARARAVRQALSYVKETPRAVLGLAPEGGDMPGGVLAWPPPGSGRFIAHLAGMGLPVTPVGFYEEAGEFCIHFGEPYRLEISCRASADREREAAWQVMTAIARLLPEHLRGEFGRSNRA